MSQPCPSCGYCPHCGRGGSYFKPYNPWYYQWPMTISSTSTGDKWVYAEIDQNGNTKERTR